MIHKKQMVPEWVEAYVDYNGLKRVLKEIRSCKHSGLTRSASKVSQQAEALHCSFSGLSFHPRSSKNAGDIEDQVIKVDTVQQDDSRKLYKTKFLKKSEKGGELEESFFKKLDENLNKVNKFYRDKVGEVLEEAALLDKQMDALIALRIKVQKPDADNLNLEKHPSDKVVVDISEDNTMRPPGNANTDIVHGIERTNIPEEEASHIMADIVPHSHTDGNKEEAGTGDKQDLHEILERVKINDALESPISTLKGVFGDSNEPISKKGLKKAEEQLRLVFSEFYQKLRRVEEYSFMNLLAFSPDMRSFF